MGFGQGYCSIECLQNDFAELLAEKDEGIIYPRLQQMVADADMAFERAEQIKNLVDNG